MKILIAKTSGFCMGVRRAVEMVIDAPEKHTGPIRTYGPLIHNPQVLNLLEEKGISAIEDIPENGEGTILIRAHGVPPQTKQGLKSAGYNVIDATCPRVIKVQTIIRKHAKKGFASIIIGDKDHPEVIGLLGYAGGNGSVAADLDELEALPAFEQAIIVAQTTQNIRFFDQVKKWAAEKFPHYKTYDTICDSTQRRQAEVKRLADTVDAIIVVGGRESGNTQRLAEIARQSGKPAYHIETEEDLEKVDFNTLSKAHQIGITAGASTPNWIIRKVYRTLETELFSRKQGWRKLFYSILRASLLTNIYVSLGAGCLCYACIKLQGIDRYFPYVLISYLYVQSMHIFNHLVGSKADRFNDPERASFYDKNKIFLTLLAMIAGGAGLVIAYTLGLFPFLILLVMSLMGLSYNLKLVPRQMAGLMYQRIKDIPGSKTILIAMAWGIVTAVLPPLSVYGSLTWISVLVFLWATGLVFVRTAFFDILDMQGDRLVGRETLPILLGEKRSTRLLKTVLVFLIAVLPIAAILDFISPLGFILVFSPICLLALLSVYQKGSMLAGARLEFVVESHFVLAGVLALVWKWAA